MSQFSTATTQPATEGESLGDLFAGAQNVGFRYLSQDEILEHEAAMAEALAEIAAEAVDTAVTAEELSELFGFEAEEAEEADGFKPGALRKAMIEAFDRH